MLQGELYFLVHNLISVTREADLQKLRKIMEDQVYLENHLQIQKLSIAPQFQFDQNYRS